MLSFIKEIAAGVFDPEAVQILAGAFDDAWKAVLASDAPFTEYQNRKAAREIIAKHIIQQARLGERDRKKLTESALRELSRANLKSGKRS